MDDWTTVLNWCLLNKWAWFYLVPANVDKSHFSARIPKTRSEFHGPGIGGKLFGDVQVRHRWVKLCMMTLYCSQSPGRHKGGSQAIKLPAYILLAWVAHEVLLPVYIRLTWHIPVAPHYPSLSLSLSLTVLVPVQFDLLWLRRLFRCSLSLESARKLAPRSLW